MEDEEVLETGHVASALREANLPKLKDIASSFISGSKGLGPSPHTVQTPHTILKETARPIPLFDLKCGDLYKQKTASKHNDDLKAFSIGNLATSGCPAMTRQGLLPGLTFKGTQHNNDHQYNVSVEIKVLDSLSLLPDVRTDVHRRSTFCEDGWGAT